MCVSNGFDKIFNKRYMRMRIFPLLIIRLYANDVIGHRCCACDDEPPRHRLTQIHISIDGRRRQSLLQYDYRLQNHAISEIHITVKKYYKARD